MTTKDRDVFLLTTRTYPGGWTKGEDEHDCLKRLKGDWGQQVIDYGYAIYLVHPDTYCDEVDGALTYPVGRNPILLKKVDGKKKPKVKA